MTKTLDIARALGGGCVLRTVDHHRSFRVDNWSPGTGQVWGREITGEGDDYAAGEMVELPASLCADIYVLGFHVGGSNDLRWVLNTEPVGIADARRKIAHQNQPRPDDVMGYELATWDAALCRFMVEGQPREVSEGPYTEAAWRDFMSALPGVVYA